MAQYREHKPRKMKLLDEARDYYVYTMRILKKIPKSDRWLGAYDIRNLMGQFSADIKLANNTAVTNKEEYDKRHAYQTDAIAIMKSVPDMLDEMMDVIHGINYDGLDTWIQTSEVIKAKLVAWQKSDEKRYQEFNTP